MCIGGQPGLHRETLPQKQREEIVQEAKLAEKYNYQRRIPLERAESAGEEGRG